MARVIDGEAAPDDGIVEFELNVLVAALFAIGLQLLRGHIRRCCEEKAAKHQRAFDKRHRPQPFSKHQKAQSEGPACPVAPVRRLARGKPVQKQKIRCEKAARSMIRASPRTMSKYADPARRIPNRARSRRRRPRGMPSP